MSTVVNKTYDYFSNTILSSSTGYQNAPLGDT